MLSSTHYGVYDNNPWENCNPLCSSISPCYNAYDSWLEMMADDGHERLPNMGPGNLLCAQHACLRNVRWSHFQPISPSLAAQPSFLLQDAWQRFDSLPQGNSVPLISKSIPTESCCGCRGIHSGCREVEGLGCPLSSSGVAVKVPCLPSLPVHSIGSHPHTRENLRMPGWGCSESQDLEQFAGLWVENLQGLQCTQTAPLSHLEWERQAPACHMKRCQTLWVCFKRKSDWIFYGRLDRRALQALQNSGASSFDILPWKNGNYWLVFLTYCTGIARGKDQSTFNLLNLKKNLVCEFQILWNILGTLTDGIKNTTRGQLKYLSWQQQNGFPYWPALVTHILTIIK